jgi:hypothetical protein
MRFLELYWRCVGFPRVLHKLDCINIQGFAEKAPQCIRGISDALGGFHDYAFVFGFHYEFVADFDTEFRADAFRYGDAVFSGYFNFVLQGVRLFTVGTMYYLKICP